MAKFCINCGKSLEEGTSCDCKPEVYQEKFEQVKQQSTTIIMKVLSTFKKVILHPYDEIKEHCISNDRVTALGLIGLQALLVALFTIACFGKMNSYIQLVAGVMSSYSVGVKFSLIQVFIITFITSFALSCGFAGILKILVVLFKGSTTYNHMLCVVSARSIGISLVAAVSIIIFYINPSYGILVFYLGNLLGICFLMTALKSLDHVEKNFISYIVFAGILLFMILSYLVIKIAIPLCLPEYFKSYWKELMEVLKNPMRIISNYM